MTRRHSGYPIVARLVGVLILVVMAGCSGADGALDGDGGPSPDPLVATEVATGLEHPWGLAFLPDGSFLVTERPGRLRIVSPTGEVSPPLTGLPSNIAAAGQGGLLDVVLDPDHETNGLIYLSFAESGSGGNGTAVARARLDADEHALESVEVIFRQQPKVGGSGHYGSRLVISGDGEHLFITTGDRQLGGQQPQQLDNEIGKVVRIRLDGQVPEDNPFAGTAGAERIWSLGHRNPQGAALHPETGELWTHEHGPQGGDEVNITTRGDNFGWPVVSYGCGYGQSPCEPIGGGTHAPDYVEPVASWGVPSTAPSGMAFYTGDAIGEWRGRLLVGALQGRTVWVLDPRPGERMVCLPAAERQHCAEAEVVSALDERIRDVRQGPDGWVYLLTDSEQGRLIRLAR
jgi:aldose sugar dehydrogenase